MIKKNRREISLPPRPEEEAVREAAPGERCCPYCGALQQPERLPLPPLRQGTALADRPDFLSPVKKQTKSKRIAFRLFFYSAVFYSAARILSSSSPAVREMEVAPAARSCASLRLPQSTLKQGRPARRAVSKSTSLSPT